jgi:uncharacterized protein
MRDGVKIALDYVRPVDDAADTKRDTILVMTRYWRGIKGEPSNKYADLFVPHGFGVVVGDVRGTGASFGEWPHHRSRPETLDFGEVLGWIAAQPWSSGRVVGFGLSYPGNTSEWMAERNHPALKGIIPQSAGYDPYEDYFPGGVPNAGYGKDWGTMVKRLDQNVRSEQATGVIIASPGVRPVGPVGAADLVAALRAHEPVPLVHEGFQQIQFRDDRPTTWGGDAMLDWSIQEVADRISRSGTPSQNWAGWWDGSQAQAATRRFVRQSNPLNVIIGPWGHDVSTPYDPLLPGDKAIPPAPTTREANQVRFAKLCFSGEAAKERGKLLHYYTLGDGWDSTYSWPPEASRQRWYLASGFCLTTSPGEKRADSLLVDRNLGKNNKTSLWTFSGAVDIGDRRKFAAGRLAYTSQPLTRDLKVTGHPTVHLTITSTREDGAFFVYLDGIKPDGEVYYLAQGVLRAQNRKVWTDSPFKAFGPQHSYLKRDAKLLTPGVPATLDFTLFPISARIPAGHRIRVVLAGSDSPTFASVPANGPAPTHEFHCGPDGCSIDLPVVQS